MHAKIKADLSSEAPQTATMGTQIIGDLLPVSWTVLS
jgi:hypothetical protein